MAAPFGKLFGLPVNFDQSSVPKPEDGICIISIFGKSRHNPFLSKASILNPVVDKEIFQGPEGLFREEIENGSLECYFDSSSRVLYMHLTSHYDINILHKKCQDLGQSSNIHDFYTLCGDEDSKHAKTLLLLFTLSHIMLLFHPGGTFDLSYLRLFHALDTVRLKLHTSMSEVLSAIPGVSSKWSNFGRVCTPRMLFIFETTALDVQPEDIDSLGTKSSKKYPPLKKLQMGIEDTIYRILRKARAITNISNNSLFSVPVNQPFVYLQVKHCEVSDPQGFLTSLIHHHCSPATDEPLSGLLQRPKSYALNRRKVNPPIPEPLTLSSPSTLSWTNNQQTIYTSFPLRQQSLNRGQDQSLKEFLSQHIEMVFSKTINDNVGRHGVEPIFELPNLGTWLQVANKLHSFFFLETYSNVTSQPFSLLRTTLDISTRFSENRCNKVLPLAESAYQQDLPQFYITSYHENRLNKAKRVFKQYARGPGFDKYMKELEASCLRYWKAGRQQCEAVSLSGNLCTSKVHRLPGEQSDGPEDVRPECNHCSQVKTKAACNCGRIQADRGDPFDFKFANFDFYQNLESICCAKLEHIRLPFFTPTTQDARAVPIISPSSSQHDLSGSALKQGQKKEGQDIGDQAVDMIKDMDKVDAFGTLSELSLALSLGQSALQATDFEVKTSSLGEDGASQMKASDEANTKQPSSPDIQRNVQQMKEFSKQVPQRQASTTEYLAYMIHSHTPPGLLPKFSSFCLCRLGPSSFYSHVMGLDLPGFLPGSNFLLPWDIAVKPEQAWPSVAETMGSGKKRQQRKLSKASAESNDPVMSVRVFLGMEYECPRGHRFFCSGPDKIIKISANSIVKDNASRLVNMDMPIYTSCHCKQPKGCMAQMMRIYIVVPPDNRSSPASNVRVLLNPLLQPGPTHQPPSSSAPSIGSTSCPQFHPGLESPLELPCDGVWVLRLPSIYQDEHKVYLMPNDHQHLHSCVLLAGMFTHKKLGS